MASIGSTDVVAVDPGRDVARQATGPPVVGDRLPAGRRASPFACAVVRCPHQPASLAAARLWLRSGSNTRRLRLGLLPPRSP
jgi:hypothetical protein